MSVLVTDAGFQPDDWCGEFVPAARLSQHPCAVGLGVDVEGDVECGGDGWGWAVATAEALRPWFAAIVLLRIGFPHFCAGGCFELAHRLRALGFSGRLRARGNILAHEYTLARRAGFDEVEISAAMALRQPEEHWRLLGHWRHGRYRSRMPA